MKLSFKFPLNEVPRYSYKLPKIMVYIIAKLATRYYPRLLFERVSLPNTGVRNIAFAFKRAGTLSREKALSFTYTH